MKSQSHGIFRKATTKLDKASSITPDYTALFIKNTKLTSHGAVPWGDLRSVVRSIGQWWWLPIPTTGLNIINKRGKSFKTGMTTGLN